MAALGLQARLTSFPMGVEATVVSLAIPLALILSRQYIYSLLGSVRPLI